jgi:hypothetical protein
MEGEFKLLKKKERKALIIILLFISIAVIKLTVYSERYLIDEIKSGDANHPLIIYKIDYDINNSPVAFMTEIYNEMEKTNVTNYIAQRKIKRIMPSIESYFDSTFDLHRIKPRYTFEGRIRNFEILGNKYIRINRSNRSIYYKFVDELKLNELEELVEFQNLKK